MNWMKKITILLFIVILSLVLVSCTAQKPKLVPTPDKVPHTDSSDGKVELNVIRLDDNVSVDNMSVNTSINSSLEVNNS